ncbi:hypothetical protein LAZ40_09540 [Cereibacter sphaeroides]|uniref:hypothetical protein n=1 Tax=Cereibacter sphaeroides TaxID=1063 RepID=UPI001F25DB04|nr:hypothetical protein [Cereibacter sphaeroides]MCE6959294.1 hypothetical protein [Cereibacter sphaeroides]MCE6972886.1 hypothetical protein [Cereibacter sphaeroides]
MVRRLLASALLAVLSALPHSASAADLDPGTADLLGTLPGMTLGEVADILRDQGLAWLPGMSRMGWDDVRDGEGHVVGRMVTFGDPATDRDFLMVETAVPAAGDSDPDAMIYRMEYRRIFDPRKESLDPYARVLDAKFGGKADCEPEGLPWEFHYNGDWEPEGGNCALRTVLPDGPMPRASLEPVLNGKAWQTTVTAGFSKLSESEMLLRVTMQDNPLAAEAQARALGLPVPDPAKVAMAGDGVAEVAPVAEPALEPQPAPRTPADILGLMPGIQLVEAKRVLMEKGFTELPDRDSTFRNEWKDEGSSITVDGDSHFIDLRTSIVMYRKTKDSEDEVRFWYSASADDPARAPVTTLVLQRHFAKPWPSIADTERWLAERFSDKPDCARNWDYGYSFDQAWRQLRKRSGNSCPGAIDAVPEPGKGSELRADILDRGLQYFVAVHLIPGGAAPGFHSGIEIRYEDNLLRLQEYERTQQRFIEENSSGERARGMDGL